jgi:hypothetical protein
MNECFFEDCGVEAFSYIVLTIFKETDSEYEVIDAPLF